MKLLFSIFLIFISIYAKEISIATYNVENLFDDKNQGSEYNDYVIDEMGWNKDIAKIKLDNTAQAIAFINADIIGLQEIENKEILNALSRKTGYKYSFFSKHPKAAIGISILSRYEIISAKTFPILGVKTREIICAKIKIEGKNLFVFVVHFPSNKRSYREKYAAFSTLRKILQEYEGKDYVVVGDFNENFQPNSLFSKIFIDTSSIDGLFNLWNCVEAKDRFSYFYARKKITLDHILLSKTMFLKDGFGYIDGSFKVVKPWFLTDKYGNPNRWKRNGKKDGRHLGEGYSDHFPLKMKIDTSGYKTKLKHVGIDDLFKHKDGKTNLYLTKTIVIYKNKEGFVLGQNGRGIYVYNPGFELNLGAVFDVRVNSLGSYNGAKQITSMYILEKYPDFLPVKSSMLSFSKLKLARPGDVIDEVYGRMDKNTLVTKYGNILVYAKNPTLMPKDRQNVRFEKVRVGMHNKKLEIILEK